RRSSVPEPRWQFPSPWPVHLSVVAYDFSVKRRRARWGAFSRAPQILRADGKAADALSRGRENRVAQRGRGAGNAGFADSALFVRARYDVHFDFRALVDAQHGIVIEIALLHAAVFQRDFAAEGCGEA